jgi:glycine/D-amino acid oxidase-like deaminating enzyme
MFSRTLKAKKLPDDGPRNGWHETLPPPPPARVVEGRIKVDFAVIGAGTCGCAVARRLGELRPDESVVLVEASRVGYGTSGRNAGFMLDYHSHGGEKHLEASADADLKGVSDGLDRVNIPWTALDRDGLEEITGTRFYGRGVRAGGSALVQPAAMMRGLAATLPHNVTLYEESPVTELSTKGGFRLVCPEGIIEAKQVILCTNLFAEEMGVFKHRIVPLATFASLTRPLTDQEMAQVGSGGEFGLLPANANGSTVRLTQDRRIFMRNSLHYAREKRFPPELMAEVENNHQQSIIRRWPDLARVEFVGTWGGVLGFTRNEGSAFGAVGDGLWALAAADTGPMTKGAIGGKLLAELICGVDSELLQVMLSLPKAGLLPPDPILRFIVDRRIGDYAASGPGER